MRENPRPAMPINHQKHFSGQETDFSNKGTLFDFEAHNDDEEDWDGSWDGLWQDYGNQSPQNDEIGSDWSSEDDDWNQDHHCPDEDYYGDWETD